MSCLTSLHYCTSALYICTVLTDWASGVCGGCGTSWQHSGEDSNSKWPDTVFEVFQSSEML